MCLCMHACTRVHMHILCVVCVHVQTVCAYIFVHVGAVDVVTRVCVACACNCRGTTPFLINILYSSKFSHCVSVIVVIPSN